MFTFGVIYFPIFAVSFTGLVANCPFLHQRRLAFDHLSPYETDMKLVQLFLEGLFSVAPLLHKSLITETMFFLKSYIKNYCIKDTGAF